MQTIMWNKRRLTSCIVISILTLFALKAKQYSYYKQATLKNVNAEQLWDFLADFTNSEKHLNPHLKIEKIDEESGNYDNWKYVVHYTEPFPTWPYLNSFAKAHFTIQKVDKKHFIKSTHNTCILRGLYCVDSNVVFELKQINGNTLYEEYIEYFCPRLLSSFCHNTNTILRDIYFNNMIKYFKMTYY